VIDSNPFGPVRLTDEEAQLFKEDLQKGAPDSAVRLFQLGQAMYNEFLATGEVEVEAEPSKVQPSKVKAVA